MAKNYTEETISILVNSMIGKTFGEINDYQITDLDYNKGTHGHIFENDVFDYEINNISAPDFIEAGIELKVTPYKINKNNSLSAKERLVLNIINYKDEYQHTFYDSHFWFKNNKIQIVWYLWEKDKKKSELKVTHAKLFTFPQEDLKTIIDDWQTIINKIKEGKAHEISEADTMYLGACPKGENSSSLREQPFSDIKAMQRAFCLKTTYMTQLVRKYIGNCEEVEKILANSDLTFNKYIENIINKYKNKSRSELMNIFNIDSNAKNLNNMIICRMFGIKGNLRQTDEFLKANIIPKTIRVEENGIIKESMSFPYFKFKDIMKQDWLESKLRNELTTTKYMFFIFKKDKNDYIFKGIKLWNMPLNVIDSNVKEVWIKTKEVISSGNIVKEIKNNKRITNFPGITYNKICHVRPHGRNSNDTCELPVKDKLTGLNKYTKQCFWLNNDYLEIILKDFL